MNKNEFNFVDTWHKSLQNRERAMGVDFHPIYNWLCVAQADGVIKLWDYEHDTLLHNFFIVHSAMCVAFHPTRNMIAVGSNARSISFFHYKINQQEKLKNNDCTDIDDIDDIKNGEELELKDVMDVTTMNLYDENDSKNKNYYNENFDCDYITLESQDSILTAHRGWVTTLSFYPFEFIDESTYKSRSRLLLSCGFDAKIWDIDEKKELCIFNRIDETRTLTNQTLSCAKWCVIRNPKSNDTNINDGNRTFVLSSDYNGTIYLFAIDIVTKKSKIASDNRKSNDEKEDASNTIINTNTNKFQSITITVDNTTSTDETKEAQSFKKQENQDENLKEFSDEKIEMVAKYSCKHEWKNPLQTNLNNLGSLRKQKKPMGIGWIDIDTFYGINGDTIFATSCDYSKTSVDINTQLDAIRLCACDVGGNVHILDIIIDDNNDFVDCIHSTHRDQHYTKVYFFHNMNQRFIFGSTFGPLNILNLGASNLPITTNHNIVDSKPLQSFIIRQFGSKGQNGYAEYIAIKSKTNCNKSNDVDMPDIMAVCYQFGITLYKFNRNSDSTCNIDKAFLSEEKQIDDCNYNGLAMERSLKDSSGL